MNGIRYHGRHLKPRPKKHGPAVVGTAAAVWFAGPQAQAAGHRVRAGETLTTIATRYGTTVSRLASLNHLRNPDLIILGERLRVPARQQVDSVHEVQAGETLSSIAARYGTTVSALVSANHVKDPNLIVAGTKLKVPGAIRTTTSSEAAPAAAPTAAIELSLKHQAAIHGVPAALVEAVAWEESGWQQDVVSNAGALGVMQVMPHTARFINRTLGGGHLRVSNMADNVHLGVIYLRYLLHTQPSERKALAAYNSGPGNVGPRLKGFQRPYVRTVEALKRRFS
ncbi:MAG: LysM peptidoglycan-binding domain-containing protein [Actinomycetota bacterium]|nr:LysM peptidoglycan-binding domain-containing protein [Actinomycetota bacterium]